MTITKVGIMTEMSAESSQVAAAKKCARAAKTDQEMEPDFTDFSQHVKRMIIAKQMRDSFPNFPATEVEINPGIVAIKMVEIKLAPKFEVNSHVRKYIEIEVTEEMIGPK